MYEILKDFQVLVAGILAVLAAGIGFAAVWHRLDQKLHEAKTEMQLAYSTLKMSVDLTLAGQGEYRAKVIEGVEELWNAILAVKQGREHLLEGKGVYHDILLSRSRRRSPPADNIGQIRENVSERHIVFIGDKLWYVFLRIMNFYSIIDRLNDVQADWRTDDSLIALLHRHFWLEARDDALESNIASELAVDAAADGLASKSVEVAKKEGLGFAEGLLEDAFLREARRVMTGSREFADSLS